MFLGCLFTYRIVAGLERNYMNSNLLQAGAPVITSDGHFLGNVTHINPECFKVDIPMAPDDWIGFDVVASVGEEVSLTLTREELEGEPHSEGHHGYHAHNGN
jgi:hypothetical protein